MNKPPIDFDGPEPEPPHDVTLSAKEVFAILLLALVLVVVGFVLGFGVASWLI